jgi:NDP-sugar pyrophosphorylase family protein
MITQAFVLGAGLGTRLRPLTDELPKPLLPIFQKPLITFALDHLIASGVKRFVINTHHLAPQFQTLFAQGSYRNCSIQLVHEPDLLETGGGIKNAEPWLGQDSFIVYSGDILTDLNLDKLINEHVRCGNDVTLALRRTGLASGVILKEGRIVDIRRGTDGDGNFDYANVSIWNSSIFEKIPAKKKISFIPILVEWIRAGGRIGGIVLDEGKWFNIGSRTEYLDVHRTIAKAQWKPGHVVDRDWPKALAESASIAPGVRLEGCSVIGDECRVGEGALLQDTIVWPGSQIASRSDLQGCIVRSRKMVEGTHRNADI